MSHSEPFDFPRKFKVGQRAEKTPWSLQNDLLQELGTELIEANRDPVGPHNDWKVSAPRKMAAAGR